jgi:hypothetical protein
MNKLWLLLLIPLLLTGFACVGNDDTAAADSLASKLAAMQATILQHTAVIDSLKSDINQKASKSEIDDLNRKINNLPQGGTSSDVYTKAQVNEEINKAIKALKEDTDQSWIKKTTTTTTTTTGTISDYAKLMDSDGELELWLEWTDPDRDDIRFSSNSVDFQVAVKNKSDSTCKYTIEMRFTPDVEVAVSSLSTDATQIPNPNGSPSTITERPDMGTWTMEGARYPDGSKSAITLVSAEGRISRNAIDKYTITLRLSEGTQKAYWSRKFYIAEID